MAKEKEKLEAIKLRKEGLSYNEILRRVSVRKSTLSVWLRDIGIAKKHLQHFTERRRLAQLKAQKTCRNNRITRQNDIIEKAKSNINNLTIKDLMIAGSLLYWAEGSKQKETNVSQRIQFGNSDPRMIILFRKWIKEVCDIPEQDIIYCLYIHKNAAIAKSKKYWEELLEINIERVYFKKHNPKTIRKNTGDNYNGLLRIDIRRSTDLNRKIQGWISGIIEKLLLI